MNIIIYKNTIKVLSALAFIFSVSFTQNVSAIENEAACKAHIQDKIAWDPNSSYNSSSHWEDDTLETMCKGTKSPKEPGECFHKVMTGHVKWGRTDKWEWKNAVALCAGTDDSDQRISCFKTKLDASEKYDDAISHCNPKTAFKNVAE
jgi:hypothetical protein